MSLSSPPRLGKRRTNIRHRSNNTDTRFNSFLHYRNTSFRQSQHRYMLVHLQSAIHSFDLDRMNHRRNQRDREVSSSSWMLGAYVSCYGGELLDPISAENLEGELCVENEMVKVRMTVENLKKGVLIFLFTREWRIEFVIDSFHSFF
ncbi:unnamed protein product [Vicia faba]|uniref:Uncharacterized protein n=1 Tax=Vicia faba TaxID=3906 RepID=A0AAV1B6U7_VICFA|nr:unnamed protein product [Vicia faba]